MATAIDIVTGYLAAIGDGEPSTIAGFVADDFGNEHLSALGAGSVGREEYLHRLPDFLATFVDRRYAIDHLVEQRASTGTSTEAASEVVVRYRFTAIYDGHHIEIPGVMWFGVRDGVIVNRVDVWDSLTFLHQTGQR